MIYYDYDIYNIMLYDVEYIVINKEANYGSDYSTFGGFKKSL